MEQQLDELAAGSLWRVHKLRTFEERARRLGLLDDPQIQRVLCGIAEHTSALEDLATLQRQSTTTRRWWADGEYDDTRADAANDKGMALFSRKEYRAAYDAYTEAIRLAPLKPTYHDNRAAAALRLGNFEGAVADAEEAARLNPQRVSARLRAARAHLALHRPEQAIAHFDAVLILQPEHDAARVARAEARAMLEQLRSSNDKAAAAALRGERPALLRTPVSCHEAAEQLLAAEAMLRAQPRLEGAKCGHVESLILCRAYKAALSACDTLEPSSLDGLYLRAEALWRSGKPELAVEALQTDCAASSDKCNSLMQFLQKLLADLAAADGASVDKLTRASAIPLYTKLLECASLHGTHMQALLLRRRASVHDALSDRAHALADLGAALSIHPSDVDALLQRARLHRAAGDEERCFLDLRAAHTIEPQRVGAWQAVRSAAKSALRAPASSASAARQGNCARQGSEDLLPRNYRILGIPLSATERDIVHAYRTLAAKWHPDKWATAPEEKQKVAETRFRVVAEAYETLKDPDARAKHDRDFFFSAGGR